MEIQLKDIVKRFGTLEAVSHVSLEIHDGELFTLLGPSGCGKTTILRLIGGFHKPDNGEICFDGKVTKPTSICGRIEDPENPRSLDELIEATGAHSVHYEDKLQCCGGGVLAIDEQVALAMCTKKVRTHSNPEG